MVSGNLYSKFMSSGFLRVKRAIDAFFWLNGAYNFAQRNSHHDRER